MRREKPPCPTNTRSRSKSPTLKSSASGRKRTSRFLPSMKRPKLPALPATSPRCSGTADQPMLVSFQPHKCLRILRSSCCATLCTFATAIIEFLSHSYPSTTTVRFGTPKKKPLFHAQSLLDADCHVEYFIFLLSSSWISASLIASHAFFVIDDF